MSDEKNLPVPEDRNLENTAAEGVDTEYDTENVVSAVRKRGSNEFFRQMMDRNFLDYASYIAGSGCSPKTEPTYENPAVLLDGGVPLIADTVPRDRFPPMIPDRRLPGCLRTEAAVFAA